LLFNDQSCIVSGFSNSSDGDIPFGNGNFDYWLFKLPDISALADYTFADNFAIYPNPTTTGEISIGNFGSITCNISARIINAEGSVVFSERFQGNDSHTINVSGLPKGLYLLTLTDNNQTSSKKLIVQ